MTTLSNRLQHIADLVPSCDTLYDVGCDHGYLGIYLLQQKRCNRVVFTDIHKEPLESAKNNALLAGFTEACDFVLTDGLKGLSPKADDAVCICGMGGPMMESIIRAADTSAYMVLEPQSDVIAFHRFLDAFGFIWDKEDMIKEASTKYYPIDAGRINREMKVKHNVPYPLLKDSGNECFKEFLDYRLGIVSAILDGNKKLPHEREAELISELNSLK